MKTALTLSRIVRNAARNRCGYCLSQQRFVFAKLEIEHIIPKSNGGTDKEDNLWLSCSLCNRYKASQIQAFDQKTESLVELFNPRHQKWSEHFEWSNDNTKIVGLTATGRATTEALKLNNEIAVEVRRNWVLAGWHPPQD